VGDCIFRDGYGRTDLPGADTATLKKSITEEILTLPNEFTLLSGHGAQTTVGREKSESVMLAQLLQFPG
jgi:glyoxylase-like metal-dependent hydrolase (beta-lactamase superfamily II)